MKFVITGALGHIGSKLIRELPNWYPDCKIIMIDNLSAERYCSLYNLSTRAKYQFVHSDVASIDLEEYFNNASAVVHLAATTNAAGSFDKAKEVEYNNFNATNYVANACFNNNIPLVFISSTSVYGTSAKKVDEYCSIDELKPQSPYAETKLKEEDLIKKLSNSGLRSIIFRFGTIFGTSPGMRFHTAVNKFCWQASIGEPITVWRTAYDQLRPYLDLEDAMQAFNLALKNSIFDGEIYNVLTGNYSVREIVSVIRDSIPQLKIEFVDSKIMNQLSYEVLDHKFRQLGYKRTGDLNNGIRNTLNLLRI
tara:strand:- start:1767 stop:2690 length:924 start_codon:yes stop_codon:yes gene_type:complete